MQTNIQTTSEDIFNTDFLLNEVNTVIQKGITHLLKDFMQKYKLYENTYNGVLNLPAVKYINHELCNRLSFEDTSDKSPLDIRKEEINALENSFRSFTSDNAIIMKELLLTIELLKEEVKELKQHVVAKSTIVVDLTTEESQVKEDNNKEDNNKEDNKNEDEYKVVFVKEEKEKENIILNMEDKSNDDTSVDSDSHDDESEEEEEDEVEVEQEQVVEEEEKQEETEESDKEEEQEQEVETEESDNEEEQEQAEEEEEEAVETEEEKEKEEEDFFEIEIEDITYCTNNEENGIIYELSADGDIGKKVGFLVNGEATFYE